MASGIAFSVGLLAIVTIAAFSSLKFVRPRFEFWPPPSPNSWQHRVFRALFRVFFATLLVLSFVDFQPGSIGRHVIGGIGVLLGFGFALRWTGFLGWRDAFGEATGRKTTGPYAWSRNPIYVVSILGMAGWAVAVGSGYLSVLLALWALLYIGAPFVEEP